LYYIILYRIILYYIVLYYIYYIVLYYILLYYIILGMLGYYSEYIYVLFYCTVCTAVLHTLDVGLLARSQYPECPATGHLDKSFSWFPCV